MKAGSKTTKKSATGRTIKIANRYGRLSRKQARDAVAKVAAEKKKA
jgi:hypothetical protein